MEQQFNLVVLLFTIFSTGVVWDYGIRNQRKEIKKLQKLKEEYAENNSAK